MDVEYKLSFYYLNRVLCDHLCGRCNGGHDGGHVAFPGYSAIPEHRHRAYPFQITAGPLLFFWEMYVYIVTISVSVLSNTHWTMSKYVETGIW